MSIKDKLPDKVKRLIGNKFIRNIGWLSGAELFVRISRLVTTVVLARFLTEYDYGLVAIVLATDEFTRVFTQIGIGAKLIQADEERLEELCNSAYWLTWAVFAGLFVLQCIASFGIAWFYSEKNLILPICVDGIVYLLTPIAAIQAYLLQRENRLEIKAISNAVVLSTGNILSLVFAFLGWGVWAIVIARVLASPLWVYIHYVNHKWRPTQGFTTNKWGEIFQFGKNLLGVELLKALRNNLDYLLVGRLIGIRELGIYFFAFNAGLGISLSIIKAINSALLPHLCSIRGNLEALKQQYMKSLKVIAAMIVPLVVLQAGLAPIYVPIVFGEKWVEAIPVLMLICLSAIPRPFGEAASQLMVAIGKPNIDFKWSIIFTFIFTIGLFVGVQWQAIGVATSVLIVHFLLLPGYTLWAGRYAFKPTARQV